MSGVSHVNDAVPVGEQAHHLKRLAEAERDENVGEGAMLSPPPQHKRGDGAMHADVLGEDGKNFFDVLRVGRG